MFIKTDYDSSRYRQTAGDDGAAIVGDSAGRSVYTRSAFGLGCGERRFRSLPRAPLCLLKRGGREGGVGGCRRCHTLYTDAAYARAGAKIVTRAETLRADVVISLAALSPAEVSGMRRGSVFLTLGQSVMDNAGSAAAPAPKGCADRGCGADRGPRVEPSHSRYTP